MKKKIRVFIVDDSLLFRKMLIDNLSQYDDLEIVGYATDAMDAMKKIPLIKPDVITLDVEMPKMTGIEFLKQLIPKYPIPVILCSSLNLNVFDALSAGAVDFVRKPDNQTVKVNTFIVNLVTKIKIASVARVKVPTQPLTAAAAATRPSDAPKISTNNALSSQRGLAALRNITMNLTNNSPRLNSFVIAIGASTGGTEATIKVIQDLPENTPGIVITQHMPEGFTKMYAERLNRICKMRVREAKNGDLIERGLILVAPGDFQMGVMKTGSHYAVKCIRGDKVSGHRPSVDFLFRSMAENVMDGMGIILTGMGQDGAKGLLQMRQKKFYTLGQSKESCVVYGMPMEAYKLGAVVTEAPCEKIPELIMNHLNGLK